LQVLKALALHRQGRVAEAEALVRDVVQEPATDDSTLYASNVLFREMGRRMQILASCF
jgi:hypothetical protein